MAIDFTITWLEIFVIRNETQYVIKTAKTVNLLLLLLVIKYKKDKNDLR